MRHKSIYILFLCGKDYSLKQKYIFSYPIAFHFHQISFVFIKTTDLIRKVF